MSGNNYKKVPKKSSAGKKAFITIVCIVLILGLGASIALNVLMYQKINNDGIGAPGADVPPLDDGNVVVTPIEPIDPVDPVDPDNPQPVLRKLAMTPRTAVLADDNTAINIPITVTPDVELPGTKIDWTIAFNDELSTWANGKTVTTYATITPTTDGAYTANLKVSQAFAEQIIITASVRDDSEVNAVCTVDYVKKYTLSSIKNSTDFAYLTSAVNESIGTIIEDYTITAKMELSNNGKTFISEFANALANIGVECSEAAATANFSHTSTYTNSAPQFTNSFNFYQIIGDVATAYLMESMSANSPANEAKTLSLLGVDTSDATKLSAIRKAFKKACDQMSFCTATDTPYSYAIKDFVTVTFTLKSEHSSSTVSASLMPLFGVNPLVGSLTINPPSIII